MVNYQNRTRKLTKQQCSGVANWLSYGIGASSVCCPFDGVAGDVCNLCADIFPSLKKFILRVQPDGRPEEEKYTTIGKCPCLELTLKYVRETAHRLVRNSKRWG